LCYNYCQCGFGCSFGIPTDRLVLSASNGGWGWWMLSCSPCQHLGARCTSAHEAPSLGLLLVDAVRCSSLFTGARCHVRGIPTSGPHLKSGQPPCTSSGEYSHHIGPDKPMLATSSTCVLKPHSLRYMASYDMASNICQARYPPRHPPHSEPSFIEFRGIL
jgi:hypothetical protein